MGSFDIYIPTFSRAGKMITHKVFPDAYIVCPVSQYDEYKKYYPEMKFMPCPDEVEGNMGRKRNWIKDHSLSDWLVMVDDDISGFEYKEKNEMLKLRGEHLLEVIHNGFVMCEELGTVLWGINLNNDPKVYREYSPISFLSVVLGPFSAHIKSKLRYDENLPTKEDYDYSLRVLHRYHKILRFNKYSYVAGHLDNKEGGSISIRRMALELEQNEYLKKKWGSRVVSYNMKKSVNPIIKIPLSGI